MAILRMRSLLSLVLFTAFSSTAGAVEMRQVTCWKGFSSREQAVNLQQCWRQRGELQRCSDNLWEHRGATFDVCLLETVGAPTTIVSHFKGGSRAEFDRNLEACRTQEGGSRICVGSPWIHGQAAFDVCLME